MQVVVREGKYALASTGGETITVEITINGKTYVVSEERGELDVRAGSRPLSVIPVAPNAIRVRAD